MMPDLSPAQIERLAVLVEELGEALHVAGKCLRHGLDSTHRDYDFVTNRTLLQCELGDVQAAVDLLTDAGDLHDGAIEVARRAKHQRILPFLHHQKR